MEKESYLFFTFAIPKVEMVKIFQNDKFPAIQTDKFIWNLIKGIENEKNEIVYISSRPVSDYPYYKEKCISKKEYYINLNRKKIKILEIPFINISVFKIITRLLFGFYYGIKEFKKKKNKKAVIVYSVTIPYLILGYIFSKFYKIELIAIWTDPPSVINQRDSSIKTKLRKIELKLSKFFMRKFDKVISLTKELAEDFCPQKPYLVIEGIINLNSYENKDLEDKKVISDIKNIVYTGTLEEKYGIKNIIDSLKYITVENIELHIYGRGNYEKEIENICERDKRIKYFGFVENEKILKIQKEATFLINARSKEDEYVKYSFPSKMMEYMASGTPVITTILSGFPDEYIEHLICLENNLPETIAKKILEVLSWKTSKRRKIGENARRFILSKSYKEQGKKIKEFIES